MSRPQSRQIRSIANLLTFWGILLLLVGAAIGWLVPALDAPNFANPIFSAAQTTITQAHLDTSSYLGADITALAVIIAVVIGFNATTLQIAGQVHSLSLVRVILLSLTPFLLCWSLTTGVALIYFLLPPLYVAQLWQMLCWFAAVVILMVAYLWDLPWRLSGDYVARWALRSLARAPIDTWESLDSYSSLQTAITSASGRGDLGTVRVMTSAVGYFLTAFRDSRAEAENAYNRSRYRALKNLLSASAQNVAVAPNAVAYQLGYITAGTLLQCAAVGVPLDDPDHNVFSGLLREVHARPERINPLWTGLRHALCRADGGHPPYLLRYWVEHRRWTSDDPRWVLAIGDGIAAFYSLCSQELASSLGQDAGASEATDMLVDLYRYIASHLGKQIAHEHRQFKGKRTLDLPLGLLDRIHLSVMRAWPASAAEQHRVTAVNAYETYRNQLTTA
ncbi:MAG: hypothetical protein ACLQUY_13125 [Ktedonobacterales bacterium]